MEVDEDLFELTAADFKVLDESRRRREEQARTHTRVHAHAHTPYIRTVYHREEQARFAPILPRPVQ